jgi:hypothetical protein
MAKSAWDIMTGATGSVRRWNNPGLDMLGTKSPSESKYIKPRRPKKTPVRKIKPHTYKEHRDAKEMDLLDELNAAMGLDK